MNPKKSRAIPVKIITALAIIAAILLTIFLIGRYGWKLGGFRACQSAAIENVEVTDRQVTITGYYPGFFSEGFLGYHAEETDGKLYVGFKFSAVFGIFETGDFDVTIPVKGEINEVIVKTRMSEYPIWNAEDGAVLQSERYGVYVKLETNDAYSLSMSYTGESHNIVRSANVVLESGVYLFVENDIAFASKKTGKPIPFTLVVTKNDGSVFASGTFAYDYNEAAEKMYLTVTADGQIFDDTAGRVPSPVEKPTMLETYATVIGEYYTTLEEEWDAAAVMEAGLNYLVADSFFDTPLEDIGYAVTDLDGDGMDELAIGPMAGDEFFGKMVFSLYTLASDGVPQLLFNSTERNRYYYAGGSNFANLGSSDWNESFVTTRKLEDRKLIDVTYTTDPVDYVQMELTPFSQWVE